MNSLHLVGSPVKAVPHAAGSLSTDWFGLTPNLFAGMPQPDGTSFASLFAGLSNAAPSASNADPLAQLSALIKNGTPISTIVDRLAQQLAGAVQHLLPAQTGAASGARLKTSLVQSIANALAPPGNAPPGTAGQEAAALAQRLRQWIATIAGDAKTTAGQQNELSGQLLDAKSAKEIPAQRKSDTASTQVDPDALARALLSSVAATFTQTPAGNASSSTSQAPAAPANAPAPQNGGPAAPAPQITMANAPDLLARMLVRAASVDAKVNGVAAASAAPASLSGTDRTPAALAARFENALVQIAAQGPATNAQGNSSDSNAGGDSSQQSDVKPSPSADATPFGVPVAANAVGPSASFAAQVQTHAASAVDANAVVEQIVKSMTMRTAQSGSSEIKLRLNPDNLGELTMKITVDGSSISANVVAANSDVRNALILNHQHLAQSLSEAGLNLTGFSVDVSGGDAGRDQNRERTGGFGRRYAVHEIGGIDDAPQTAETSSSGPQLLPRSSLELFNYLA